MDEPWIQNPMTGQRVRYSDCPDDILIYCINGGFKFVDEDQFNIPDCAAISKAIAAGILRERNLNLN